MTTKAQTGIIEVAEGVYAFIQEGGATNGGFIVGDEGVIVIEGLMTQALTGIIKQAVTRVTRQPIRSLIVTHFHADHSFGNQHYLPAPVVGHAECRRELIERWDESVERFGAMRPDLAEEFRSNRMTPPDVVFDDTMALYLGSRRIELLYYGKAHTRGDILVFLPEERVVYSGDVAVEGRLPFTMDAYMSDWISVLERMEGLKADRIVPGHGLIGDISMVTTLKNVFSQLKVEARKRFDAGMSAEQAAGDIRLPEFKSLVGIDQLATPVQRLYMEFRGEL